MHGWGCPNQKSLFGLFVIRSVLAIWSQVATWLIDVDGMLLANGREFWSDCFTVRSAKSALAVDCEVIDGAVRSSIASCASRIATFMIVVPPAVALLPR